MASEAKQTVHAGHSIYLEMDGKRIGRVQGITNRTNFGTEGVYEIGSIMPQEHVPLRFEGAITVNKYVIKKAVLKTLNVFPDSVGEEILKKNIFNVAVYDKATKEAVIVYEGCTQSDGNMNMQANQILGQDCTFLCLSIRRGPAAREVAAGA